MMSTCYVYGYAVVVTGRGNYETVEDSEGKDGERAVAILRLLGGSPCLYRLRTMSFWPRGQALICTDRMSGFMGPDKPSSPVTTSLNRTSLL
jgi:hypothetical protein